MLRPVYTGDFCCDSSDDFRFQVARTRVNYWRFRGDSSRNRSKNRQCKRAFMSCVLNKHVFCLFSRFWRVYASPNVTKFCNDESCVVYIKLGVFCIKLLVFCVRPFVIYITLSLLLQCGYQRPSRVAVFHSLVWTQLMLLSLNYHFMFNFMFLTWMF